MRGRYSIDDFGRLRESRTAGWRQSVGRRSAHVSSLIRERRAISGRAQRGQRPLGSSARRPPLTRSLCSRPLPSAGEVNMRKHSRGAMASEFCLVRSRQPPKQRRKSLPRKEGRSSAARRAFRIRATPQTLPSAGVRARRRADRGALASRRFTAALATGCDPDDSAPGRASWDPASRGRYPLSPVPVQRAPRRPVVMPDGRCPGPPGSGVTTPRPRAPHLAPLQDRL